MRICFVINNLPTIVGGLEKVCLRVAQHLQKNGHEVQILGRFSKGSVAFAGFFQDTEEARFFEFQGVNLRVLALDAMARFLLKPVFKLIWRKTTFPLARWLYVAAMSEQIAQACRDMDVVHFFGNGPEMLGFAAEVAARRVGAKFVIEPALHEGQWGDKWFDALLYKQADLLLAHTRHEAGVLERMGIPSAKIRTIVHGVDSCDSGKEERFRDKFRISGPIVLFLGRKTMAKGVERLLKAWPVVEKKFPEATLVIAGPKSDAIWQMVGSGGIRPHDREGIINAGRSTQDSLLWARVLNLDDLTDEDKQDALAACDLLCVPSEGESFGMVYFEAWSYGKPVVGLNLPILQESVEASRAGLLAGNAPGDIADAICKLLGNSKLRDEMGKNGRQLTQLHSWEAALQSYLEAYLYLRLISHE